jgi:hypothetical protein
MPATISIFDDIFALLPSQSTNLDRVLTKIDSRAFDDPSYLSDIQNLLCSTIDLVNAIIQLPTKVKDALSAYTDFLDNSGIKDDLPIHLLNYLILKYLAENHPALYSFLLLTGIARTSFVPEDTYNPDYYLYEVKWDSLASMIKNPAFHFKEVYGWGTDYYSAYRLFRHLYSLVWALGIRTANMDPDELSAIIPSNSDPTYNELAIKVPLITDFVEFGSGPEDFSGYEVGITIYPTKDINNDANKGIGISPYVFGHLDSTVDLKRNWSLSLIANVELDEAIGLHITPANGVDIVSSGVSGADFRIEAKITKSNPEKIVLISIGGSDGFEASISNVALELKALVEQGQPAITTELILERFGVGIGGGDADGFLQKILPKAGISTEFDLAVGWSSLGGIFFRGSSGLEVNFPIHKTLGPIIVESVYLAIELDGGISATLAATVGAKLGPISASVEQIGLIIPISFPQDGNGNLGPVQIDNPTFKPPIGAGALVEAGPIAGGGYIKYDDANKQYAGILQLNFSQLGLTAIGLITTRMPDGSKGFSMVINISVIFNPPIPLSYGFTLSGVGGLIGINRTMMTDVLRDGLRNRTLDSILFPEDPILNAPKIISDMQSVFPPAEGRFVLGPMVKIGWGTPNIIVIDIGIFIELPMPIRIALLGQIAAFFPTLDQAIVELHIDVLGIIEFEKKELSIDATIYDSRIYQYTLTGDAALRWSWGDNPMLAMSLGGFHPQFSPPPAFPSLRLLTLNLSQGSNFQLFCMVYQALTSNSLQFGANLELYAKESGASVEGNLTFDALIYFNPFSFAVDIDGNVVAKYKGHKLAGVHVSLNLSGPTPWHAKGKATFEILVWDVSVSFNKTWGDSNEQTLPEVNPWVLLREALERRESWGSALPNSTRMVESVRSLDSGQSDLIVLHPAGTLEIRQNVLPLDVQIQKLGNSPITGHHTFNVDSISASQEEMTKTPIEEDFARGQYENLSEQDKLSLPCFEKMHGGVAARSEDILLNDQHIEQLPLEYESILINDDRTSTKPTDNLTGEIRTGRVFWDVAKRQLRGNAAMGSRMRKTGLGKYEILGKTSKVRVGKEGYLIVKTADMSSVVLGPGKPDNDGTLTRMKADQQLKAYSATHPDETGKVQVVSAYEVAV